jgi:hypothetical protein
MSHTKSKIPYLVFIIIALYSIKPSLFFKANGKPRAHGVGIDEEGYKKTLFTFFFAIFVLTLFAFVI